MFPKLSNGGKHSSNASPSSVLEYPPATMAKQKTCDDHKDQQASSAAVGAVKVKGEPPDEPVDMACATTVKQESDDGNEAAAVKVKEQPPDEDDDMAWAEPGPVEAEAASPLVDIVKCEPTLIQTLEDSLRPSPGQCRMGNEAAEYSRLYRERHREEINKRRREKRREKKQPIENPNQIQTLYNIRNMNEIENSTSSTSNNQRCSNSHKLRQQRYYERHKEEINKRKRDRRLQKNILKSIPATAAERSRNYRERHRQKINEQRRNSRWREQNVQQIHTDVNNIHSIDQMTNSAPNDLPTLSYIQNFNEFEEITLAKSTSQPCSNSHKLKQQRYYEKHKAEINKRKRDRRLQQNNSQSIPATAAERSRNYRERNRQKINEQRRESRRRQKTAHTECNISNIDFTPNDLQTLLNIRNINEIEQIIGATSNGQLSPNSITRSQQRSGETHTEDINKHKRDTTLKQNNSQSIPVTAAERSRNYRERNRQKINEQRRESSRLLLEAQRVHTECNIKNIDSTEQMTNSTPNNLQTLSSIRNIKEI